MKTELLSTNDFFVLDSNPLVISFLWKNRKLFTLKDNKLRYERIRFLIRELRAVREKYKGKKAIYILN